MYDFYQKLDGVVDYMCIRCDENHVRKMVMGLTNPHHEKMVYKL